MTSQISPMTIIAVSSIGLVALLIVVIYLAEKANESNNNTDKISDLNNNVLPITNKVFVGKSKVKAIDTTSTTKDKDNDADQVSTAEATVDENNTDEPGNRKDESLSDRKFRHPSIFYNKYYNDFI